MLAGPGSFDGLQRVVREYFIIDMYARTHVCGTFSAIQLSTVVYGSTPFRVAPPS